MNNLLGTAPSDLEERTAKYVKLAATLLIAPDLVARYARILIAAEEVVSDRERTEREIRDESARIAALQHGVNPADGDPKKARAAYARARKEQQAVHNSAKGLALQIERFERILEPRYGSMLIPFRQKFGLADITAACSLLKKVAAESAPHTTNLADVKIAKSSLSLSKAEHTYLWWRRYIQDSRWEDMHGLARCWHLTNSKRLDDFQRRVRMVKPIDEIGEKWFLRCPPWAVPKVVQAQD
jgi:hypothetical protein